jgi:outer membrane protein assembly factor BamB
MGTMKHARPVLRVVVALALVLGLAACDGAWPQFRAGAERTGYNPGESKITPANVASLQVAWNIPLPAAPVGGASAHRLVAADDKVFVLTTDDRLRAFDAATGSVLWSATALDGTEVAVAGGRAFVTTTSDRNLTALDVDTGARLWRTPTLGVPGPPTVVGDVVYVIGSDNRLNTYDAATGAVTGPGFAVGASGQVTISAADGSVYIRSGNPADGYLLQAHDGDGSLRWSRAIPFPVTAMVAEGRVYVGGRALDAATGDGIWESSTADWYSSLAYAEGTLYGQRSFSLGVTALDPATGAVRWTTAAGQAFPAYDEGPAVTDGLVWINAGFQVKALDAATGAILWASDPSIATSEALMPIVAEGRVFSFGGSGLVAWKLP